MSLTIGWIATKFGTYLCLRQNELKSILASLNMSSIVISGLTGSLVNILVYH